MKNKILNYIKEIKDIGSCSIYLFIKNKINFIETNTLKNDKIHIYDNNIYYNNNIFNKYEEYKIIYTTLYIIEYKLGSPFLLIDKNKKINNYLQILNYIGLNDAFHDFYFSENEKCLKKRMERMLFIEDIDDIYLILSCYPNNINDIDVEYNFDTHDETNTFYNKNSYDIQLENKEINFYNSSFLHYLIFYHNISNKDTKNYVKNIIKYINNNCKQKHLYFSNIFNNDIVHFGLSIIRCYLSLLNDDIIKHIYNDITKNNIIEFKLDTLLSCLNKKPLLNLIKDMSLDDKIKITNKYVKRRKKHEKKDIKINK